MQAAKTRNEEKDAGGWVIMRIIVKLIKKARGF
jgi:hypothetical protein